MTKTALDRPTARNRATTANERPALVSVDDETIFGVLTCPTVAPNGVGVVVASGGSTQSAGRNRIWARMARDLAGLGYHSMRFDWRGEGESTGRTVYYRLEEPLTSDLVGILDPLWEEQVSQVMMVGMCFGARTAMSAALELGDKVGGIALLAPPVRDFAKGERRISRPWSWYLRRALTPRGLARLLRRDQRQGAAGILRQKWKRRNQVAPDGRSRNPNAHRVSPHFLDQLDQLVARGVPVMFVFGEVDDFHDDFKQGESGRLGEILRRAGDLITVRLVDARVHALVDRTEQDVVTDEITAWLERLRHPADQRS